MKSEVILKVLSEMGVLIQAPAAAAGAQDTDISIESGSREHILFNHVPLWNYENPTFAQPFSSPETKPVFMSLPPGTNMETALEHTGFVVLLGAEASAVFRRCQASPGTFVLVFEPDAARLRYFATQVTPQSLARNVFLVHGRLEDLVPPLSELLPHGLYDLGFPVVFVLPELATARPEYVREVALLVEALYYRNRIYALSGQANHRGLPLRPMFKGLFYDQQYHAYRNTRDFLIRPDVGLLRHAFKGETAILVAAGPDLPERMDYLRTQRDRAVIIAVNNALRPMLAAGVRPHLVVANDTSLLTARSWEGLPRLEDVALVGHSLIDLGGEVFARTFLFGTYRPELFGQRTNLRLHGSVITTAFSLARLLGCAGVVLVGVQLCSQDPWKLSYARGTIHEAPASAARPLTQAYPQLVPVGNPSGQALYTSLNFLDASLWFLDEIRASGLSCLNTSLDSTVYGPGVEHDPAPVIADTGNLSRRLRQIAALKAKPRPVQPVREALGVELESWRSIGQLASRLAVGAGQGYLQAAGQVLAQFDQNNVSYLVQRFEDFDNRSFHRAVFDSADQAGREAGFRDYFAHVGRMAGVLAGVLEEQLAGLAARG